MRVTVMRRWWCGLIGALCVAGSPVSAAAPTPVPNCDVLARPIREIVVAHFLHDQSVQEALRALSGAVAIRIDSAGAVHFLDAVVMTQVARACARAGSRRTAGCDTLPTPPAVAGDAERRAGVVVRQHLAALRTPEREITRLRSACPDYRLSIYVPVNLGCVSASAGARPEDRCVTASTSVTYHAKLRDRGQRWTLSPGVMWDYSAADSLTEQPSPRRRPRP